MQITINGEAVKIVSYECTPSLIELGDRVQTIDGTDHIESRKIKRYIKATTIDLFREDAAKISNLLKNTYLSIGYEDPITNQQETRVFILQNSPSYKAKLWKNGKQYYQGIDLELTEKGAE